MLVKTKDLAVRELEEKDAKRIYQIAREPSTYRYMPNYSDGYTAPQDYLDNPDWFQKPEPEDGVDLRAGRYYAVALADGDEVIGIVARGLKKFLNEIEIGYFIAENYRGKGYAEQAVNALTAWCFEVSDIPFVIATVLCENLPSNKLLEKCGFERLEKRTPVEFGTLAEDRSYFYYRKYR